MLCVLFELVGRSDGLRVAPLGWLKRYEGWMHKRCKRIPLWDGALGVVLAMVFPLFAVWVLFYIFSWGIFTFILSILVVLISMGPKDLGSQIENYHAALTINDAEAAAIAARQITTASAYDDYVPSDKEVNKAILIQANERIVAVLFWFLILGPLGAVAYRVVSELRIGVVERGHGFVEAALDLRRIMAWVPARLLALGYALAGSLVHSLEAWRITETLGFADNDTALARAGFGALHRSEGTDDSADASRAVAEIRGLVNRTYVVLLTGLALLVLLVFLS